MLREILVSLSLVIAITPSIINGDVTFLNCKGELGNGKLEISSIVRWHPRYWIPEECTSLEIRISNGSGLNWESVERAHLPNLKVFKLYISTTNSKDRELKWEQISLFGYSPEDVERLGINFFVFLNDEQVLYYNAAARFLAINTIDSNLILRGISGQDIELDSLDIADTNLTDGSGTTPLEKVTSVTLRNVQVGNWSWFIQRFNSLSTLTIIENFETININDILQSKSLTGLTIHSTNLTSSNLTKTDTSENLRNLQLINCVQDSSFKENAGKLMPNLTYFEHFALAPEELDIKDVLGYKQLSMMFLINVKLTFETWNERLESLKTLTLSNSEFHLTKFPEFASNAFPNMTRLSVYTGSGGTAPTLEYLNGVVDKIPDVQRIEINPFYLDSLKRKGSFVIRYKYDPPPPEAITSDNIWFVNIYNVITRFIQSTFAVY